MTMALGIRVLLTIADLDRLNATALHGCLPSVRIGSGAWASMHSDSIVQNDYTPW